MNYGLTSSLRLCVLQPERAALGPGYMCRAAISPRHRTSIASRRAFYPQSPIARGDIPLAHHLLAVQILRRRAWV
jgi:hypothetical protein